MLTSLTNTLLLEELSLREPRETAIAVFTILTQHAIGAEKWVKMRKMFRLKGPAPTIQDDVAALAGGGARQAGPRLIDRGPEVLPAVHAALLATDVEPRHALALLQVMGALSEKSSVPVVLELLRRDVNNPLRRDALLVLAMLPATDDAAAFVREVASNKDEAWRTRRMAFSWYGLHRDPRGRPFAEAMRADPDPERRAPSALNQSSGYKDALRYARYRSAPVSERPAICQEMLQSQMPGHREIAVRCLLNAGHAHALRPYAAVDLAGC